MARMADQALWNPGWNVTMWQRTGGRVGGGSRAWLVAYIGAGTSGCTCLALLLSACVLDVVLGCWHADLEPGRSAPDLPVCEISEESNWQLKRIKSGLPDHF